MQRKNVYAQLIALETDEGVAEACNHIATTVSNFTSSRKNSARAVSPVTIKANLKDRGFEQSDLELITNIRVLEHFGILEFVPQLAGYELTEKGQEAYE
ncbi:MAG: hypothetical protein NT076_04045 [Candidatus Pacearchaeota archaeon]|nr:hypothetical protein [Candidatus Pacearchaeota archaeon]